MSTIDQPTTNLYELARPLCDAAVNLAEAYRQCVDALRSWQEGAGAGECSPKLDHTHAAITILNAQVVVDLETLRQAMHRIHTAMHTLSAIGFYETQPERDLSPYYRTVNHIYQSVALKEVPCPSDE